MNKFERILKELGYPEDSIKALHEAKDEDWDFNDVMSFMKDYFIGNELPARETELRSKLHKEITAKTERELKDLIVKNSSGKISKVQAETLSKNELVTLLVNSTQSDGDSKEAFNKIKELSDNIESLTEQYEQKLAQKDAEFQGYKESILINNSLSDLLGQHAINPAFPKAKIIKLLQAEAEEKGYKIKAVGNKLELVNATTNLPVYKDGGNNVVLTVSNWLKEEIKPFEAKSLGGGVDLSSSSTEEKDQQLEEIRKAREAAMK